VGGGMDRLVFSDTGLTSLGSVSGSWWSLKTVTKADPYRYAFTKNAKVQGLGKGQHYLNPD